VTSRLALPALVLLVAGCGAATTDSSTPAPRHAALHTRAAPSTVHPTAAPTAPPPDGDPASISHLDPDLLAAVEAATQDAQRDGVELRITSGWRSRAHQQRLYDEAVQKYGSEEEARRYVSTPDTSRHVTGDAVDIGPTDADSWLSQHGAAYGLCQVFANEIWHFELATTPGGTCPEMLPDSSYR
jgi:zinc D-Ala-D-Ala carboxypeptidase